MYQGISSTVHKKNMFIESPDTFIRPNKRKKIKLK